MKIIPRAENLRVHETPATHFASLWIDGTPTLPITRGSTYTDLRRLLPKPSNSGRIWLEAFREYTPAKVHENRQYLIVGSNLEVENIPGCLTVLPTDSDKFVILGLSGGIQEILLMNPETHESYLYNVFADNVTVIEDLNAYDQKVMAFGNEWAHPWPVWDNVEKTYSFKKDSFVPVVDLL